MSACTSLCVLKSKRFPVCLGNVSDGGAANAFHVVGGLLSRGIPGVCFTRQEMGERAHCTLGSLTLHRVPYVQRAGARAMERDYLEGLDYMQGVLAHPAFRPRQFRCVHTHHWSSGIGLARHLPPECRLVHTPHLLASEKARHTGVQCPREVLSAEAELVRRADCLIALSSDEAVALRSDYGADPGRIAVIPNGVSESFFHVASTQRCRSHFVVLCVGRLARQKGIDVLLDAAGLLVGRSDRLSVRVVGPSYGEPDYEALLRDRAAAALLDGRVQFVGQVEARVLPHLLGEASVYVQPSLYESQGISVLEAMAAGLPVVASDLPAIREYAVHLDNAVLVRPGDADELAEAVWLLHGDPALRTAIAERGRATASRFDWGSTVELTVQTLLGESMPQ